MTSKYWKPEDEFTITGEQLSKIISETVEACWDAVRWDENVDVAVRNLRIRRVLDAINEE